VRLGNVPHAHEIGTLAADDVDRGLDDVTEARPVSLERLAEVVDAQRRLRLEVPGAGDAAFVVDRASAGREHEVARDGGVLVRSSRPERHAANATSRRCARSIVRESHRLTYNFTLNSFETFPK
jgi:hypothetical protein